MFTDLETTGSSLQRVIWKAWPWVNWFLPAVLLAAYILSGSAGWEGVLLLYVWPGVIPALSLLSSIPRFVLRRAGWRVAPRVIVGLLIAQWAAALLFTATARGTTDGADLPSMLGNVFGIPEAAEVALNIGFLVIVVLAWIATVVVPVGSVAKSRRGTPSNHAN